MTDHSGTYGWVFGQIRVDPASSDTIYSMGLGLNVSRDAGKTFTTLRGMHSDHHGLWINPANPSILYNANDGGFYWSEDAGKKWGFANLAGGAQFYNVTLDNSSPAWAYGSIQDIGAGADAWISVQDETRFPPLNGRMRPAGGIESGCRSGQPNIVYSHGFYGNFTREDLNLSQAPAPAGGGGRAADGQA